MNQKETPWHAISQDQVLDKTSSSISGLAEDEAKRRLARDGPNVIQPIQRTSPVFIFLDQFKNLMIIILLVAAALSIVLQETLDAIVIMSIVLASACLGFWQELRASKAIEALRKLAAPTCKVVRGGFPTKIATSELVQGDLVLLSMGDKIPADLRITECWNLRVNEAPLTGESLPVEKRLEAVEEQSPIMERKSMVYAATTVVYGRGVAVVTSTGMNTEVGKVASMVQSVDKSKTPLEVHIDRIGKLLAAAMLFVVSIVAVLGIVRGTDPLQMLLLGVSLAVAAVPEALPAVVTGGLAVGVQRMAKKNAIVKRLTAIETLGCTNMICSDKTGTLTKDEMTARVVFIYGGSTISVTGAGYSNEGQFLQNGSVIDPAKDEGAVLLLRAGILCNDAVPSETGDKGLVGDPTESALIYLGAKAGLRKKYEDSSYPRIGEVPFTSERKMMTTVHSTPDGKYVILSKGAPDVLISKCNRLRTKDGIVLISDQSAKILKVNEEFAAQGLRVLALAYKFESKEPKHLSEDEVERELTFLGLIGMMDPPRAEAKEAVRVCRESGIRTIMITGDHKLTGMAVAKELEIPKNDEVLTGADLDIISDDDLAKSVEKVDVYARVSPYHKLRIVKALKNKGYTLAVTGDGINDAPALATADIGVAMGRTGTDVAREAADMILADDNFATIVSAVEEGRRVFDNIRKYLGFLLSCNVGEIILMFVAGLINLGIPLVAVQLLWINLVTDGLPALALGVDPKEEDVMRRPPRKTRESIFSKHLMALLLGISILIGSLGVILFTAYLPQGEIKARTIVFTFVVMVELFGAPNWRSATRSIFRIRLLDNKFLLLAVLSSFLLQLAVLYPPFMNEAFGTVPLNITDWLYVIGASALVFPLCEGIKKIVR